MRKPKTKAGKKAKMETAMHDFKAGKMHSGSKKGPVVKSRAQAIAIGLSQSGQSKNKDKAARLKARKKGINTKVSRALS
jgi:hypothetical protein